MSRTKGNGRGLVFLAALVFVGALVIGPTLLFAKMEPPAPKALCDDRMLQTGAMLNSNYLTVNVYNASEKSGVANRVRINLERNGFLGGIVANYQGQLKPKNVMIFAQDKSDPKVKLLAKQFKGKVEFAPADFETKPGMNVVVGPKFKGVKKDAPTTLKVATPIKVCVPTIDLA